MEQDVERNLYCRGFFKLYISKRNKKRRKKKRKGKEREQEKEGEKEVDEDEELSLDVGDKALFVSKGVGDYLARFLRVENKSSTGTTTKTNETVATAGQQDEDSYDYLNVESSVAYDGEYDKADNDVDVDSNGHYGHDYNGSSSSSSSRVLISGYDDFNIHLHNHSNLTSSAILLPPTHSTDDISHAHATRTARKSRQATTARRLVGTTRLPAAAVQYIKSAKQLRKAVVRRAVRRLRRVPGWQAAFYAVDAVSKVRIKRRGKYYVVVLRFTERFRLEF